MPRKQLNDFFFALLAGSGQMEELNAISGAAHRRAKAAEKSAHTAKKEVKAARGLRQRSRPRTLQPIGKQ